MYGVISGHPGNYEIHVSGYPIHNYMWYPKREAIRRYREEFGLKYKRINWITL